MEHRRKYERKREEKLIRERQERIKKAKEEHARAQRVRNECLQVNWQRQMSACFTWGKNSVLPNVVDHYFFTRVLNLHIKELNG